MTKLVCPACGNEDPEQFEYCELIPSYRTVLGYDEAGVLVIHESYNDFAEGAEPGWFYCRANDCNAEVKQPADLEVDWRCTLDPSGY